MDARIDFLNKLKLKLNGYVYVGDEKKPGWDKPLPFYIFKCPIHGIVKSYAKGYKKRLQCPECIEEQLSKLTSSQDIHIR
jgi:predicted transcriptional regulator